MIKLGQKSVFGAFTHTLLTHIYVCGIHIKAVTVTRLDQFDRIIV